MKHNLLIYFLSFTIACNAQVGINNSNPKATLDVEATNTGATTTEGIIGPRLTGDQIKSKDLLYTADYEGTLIYATNPVTATTAKTINITSSGYYFFDGSVWIPVGGADQTDDAWINKAGVVNMGTLSDGITARTTNQQFTFKDNGSATFGSSFTNYPSKLTLVNNASGNPLNDNLEIQSFGPVSQLGNQVYPIIDITSSVGTESSPANFPDSRTNPVGLGEIRFKARANGANRAVAQISVRYAGDGSTAKGNMKIYTSGDQNGGISIDQDNNVGLGANNPSNKLHVVAATNPLRLQGLQTGAASEDVLTVDANGVVFRRPTATTSTSSSTFAIRRMSSGTVLDTDYTIIGDLKDGNIQLPLASANTGKIFNFVYDGITFLVDGDLRGDGSNFTSFKVDNKSKSITVQSDGNNWMIISGY